MIGLCGQLIIGKQDGMLLTLVKKEHKNEIMKAILNEAGLKTPGKGICFSIPVDDVEGIVTK